MYGYFCGLSSFSVNTNKLRCLNKTHDVSYTGVMPGRSTAMLTPSNRQGDWRRIVWAMRYCTPPRTAPRNPLQPNPGRV